MTKSDSSEPTSSPRLLDGVRSPADVKALREQDLPQLAQEVRDELIKVLSQTGGHLGPNLGVVELTIALHRVFDTPKDRFVFDVSHQGYVHKMFTGRLDRIGTMRQYQGLNGFLLRTESEHDCYGAGHAGTALSAGLGMAVGRDLRGGNEHVVVVAGDAAYNDVHLYLAESNAQTRREWIDALDKIEALNPRAVVASQKRPESEDDPRIIEQTRQYIRDFDRLAETTQTAQELYDKMLELYPNRVNPGWALWSSARAVNP